MFFKSKWFWLCAVFSAFGLIFLGLMFYQAKQPLEVITVYEVGDSAHPVTTQSPEESSASVPTPSAHEAAETDTTVHTDSANFSDDEAYTTNEFTHTSDDFFADEPNRSEAANVPADVINTDVDTLANEALAAETFAEIHQALQERIELLDLVETLSEFSSEDEEIYLLARQTYEKTRELRKTIFSLSHQYIRYSDGDFSPFQPGGELYELFDQNNIGIRVE